MLVLFTLTLRQLSVQQGWVPSMEFYILHREIIYDVISAFHLYVMPWRLLKPRLL